MTLQEIMQIVFNSSRDDWVESESPDTVDEKNYTVYAYKQDLNIYIKETMGSDFHEDWTDCHPDKDAYQSLTYIYYGATLVRKIILVGVDGGRATLPMPELPRSAENSISRDMYNYAKIFDSLNTLDDYLTRSGLTIAN